jgi:hypothetical protein
MLMRCPKPFFWTFPFVEELLYRDREILTLFSSLATIIADQLSALQRPKDITRRIFKIR